MENKCEDDQHQNFYLSSLLYKQVKILRKNANHIQSMVTHEPKRPKIPRNKTQLYMINDLNQDYVQNIKRKNSFAGCKKYRKVESESQEPKCTPYQSRKKYERLYIKLKRDKISAQIDNLPIVLEESMARWLVVKEARGNSSQHLKTQPSIERVKVCIDSNSIGNSQQRTLQTKQRVKTEGKMENQQQKCIRTLINTYKNKNNSKQNIKNKKKDSYVSNKELKQSVNLKLQSISEPKNDKKIFSLKQKIRSIYVSKRQLTTKSKKSVQEHPNTTQTHNNLLLSTHSDITDKAPRSTLQGVLNSFKVDMKFKQLGRPNTASRIYKPSLTSQTKLPQKNASSNAIQAIQMTGWQEQAEKFDRDTFFS